MYRVAIVGGETHIGEITTLPGQVLRITGVSVRPDQVNWARGSFKAEVFTDFREMLARQPIDIVAVANENDKKAAVILEALKQGKHVIADKPMALTIEELDGIEKRAQEENLRVLMLLTLRGDPWYLELKELVRSGRIGTPMQVYGKMSVELKRDQRPPWFLNKYRAGGPILDMAIHTIDQIEWITGLCLIEVTAYEANISDPVREEFIDSGAMFFRLSNGGTAMVEQNRVMPPGAGSDYRFNVVGTKGQVNLRLGKSITIHAQEGGESITADDIGSPVSVVADWLETLSGGTEALVPDEASFRASRIACLAKVSADTGAKVAIPH